MPNERGLRDRGGMRRAAGLLMLLGAFLFGWIWFVGNLHLHEMVVGVVVAALTAAFSIVLRRSSKLDLTLRWADVLQIRRIPLEIARDTRTVLVVLFRDVFLGERAGSFYRVAGFRASRRDPVLAARAALAITYTTLSPNMIVVGIDPAQGHMLFHQLRREDVPASTQALGAGR